MLHNSLYLPKVRRASISFYIHGEQHNRLLYGERMRLRNTLTLIKQMEYFSHSLQFCAEIREQGEDESQHTTIRRMKQSNLLYYIRVEKYEHFYYPAYIDIRSKGRG